MKRWNIVRRPLLIVALIVARSLLAILVFGPGIALGYFMITKGVMLHPTYLEAGIGARIFPAIMLGGGLTVFLGLMANWKGE